MPGSIHTHKNTEKSTLKFNDKVFIETDLKMNSSFGVVKIKLAERGFESPPLSRPPYETFKEKFDVCS
jgi:hypothetical protein